MIVVVAALEEAQRVITTTTTTNPASIPTAIPPNNHKAAMDVIGIVRRVLHRLRRPTVSIHLSEGMLDGSSVLRSLLSLPFENSLNHSSLMDCLVCLVLGPPFYGKLWLLSFVIRTFVKDSLT